MADMRKRFRGNGPLSTGKYDQKLEQLSGGNFNAEEELASLATQPVISSNPKVNND
jgi:cytochrome c oxidase assembly factor 5